MSPAHASIPHHWRLLTHSNTNDSFTCPEQHRGIVGEWVLALRDLAYLLQRQENLLKDLDGIETPLKKCFPLKPSQENTLIWVARQTRCMKLTSWTWEYEARPALMWHSSGQWSVRAAARVTWPERSASEVQKSDQRPYFVTHTISG